MSTADFITVALATRPASGDRKQWVRYMPSGTFATRDGRGPWTLTDPESVVSASFSYSAGQPIPVDYDHALMAASEVRTPAPAAGWITELAVKPDGIWGLTEWTPKAAAQLAAREYRFVSPTFKHTTDGIVLCLWSAALTNQPALTALTAICSMEHTPMAMDLEGLCRALRPMLGLTDAAEPDAIVEAVRSLHMRSTAASAAPPRDQFVPIREFEGVVAALNAQSRGVSAEAAEIAVSQAVETGKLIPALRGWGISLCSENKPAFDAFIQRTAAGLQPLFVESAEHRGQAPQSRLTAVDREIAERMGHKPEDFK